MNKTTRNKELSEVISKVLEKVQEENRCLKNEVEEFHRFGRFKGEGFRQLWQGPGDWQGRQLQRMCSGEET